MKCKRSQCYVFSGKWHYSLILADPENFEKACTKAVDFCIDGTFGIIPGYLEVLRVRSSQVLQVMANYGDALVCVATVVMTCRKVPLYQATFKKISELFPFFSPQTLMSDWETALRKTAGACWPDAKTVGCW